MSITLQVRINKDYFDLVPRPTKTDYASLKNSIKEDGLHMPIIVNQDGIILDGHTRYQICKELKIKPEYEIKTFDDLLDERNFVMIANLSRRHLNLFQKAVILKNWWIEQREEGFRTRGHNNWKTRNGQKYKPKERLNARVARMLGCSHSSACCMLYLLRKADRKTTTMLRNGTIAIRAAYRITKEQNNENAPPITPKRINKTLRYPKCIRCKEPTVSSEKTGCHVHTEGCCTECGWGWSGF